MDRFFRHFGQAQKSYLLTKESLITRNHLTQQLTISPPWTQLEWESLPVPISTGLQVHMITGLHGKQLSKPKAGAPDWEHIPCIVHL